MSLTLRQATRADLTDIRRIYNEGIADRRATLDEAEKSIDDIESWWAEHGDRYVVLVAVDAADRVCGWASLNRYSHRCAYDGVADLSIYVARDLRGRGVGATLLGELERRASAYAFHKIVLYALSSNDEGLRLYRSLGYREVGTFREQGRLDGRYVDVVAMEHIL